MKQRILTLLVPGWGQARNGQPRKALLIAGLATLLLILAFVTPWLHTLVGLLSYLLLIVAGATAATIDARRNRAEAQPSRALLTLLIVPLLLLASLVFEPVRVNLLGLAAFRIPPGSESGAPTLIGGDRLVASMRDRDVERGALFLMCVPCEGGCVYVKRIVGLPGDIVRGDSTGIYVNDRRVADAGPDAFGPVEVPPRETFALGDNVGNSRDSRHFGTVPTDAIIGRPLYVLWGRTCDRIGTDLR